MSEFIAVRSTFDIADFGLLASLKRDALVVDRIAVPLLSNILSSRKTPPKFKDNVAQLRWLFNAGLIFEPPTVINIRFPTLGPVFSAELKRLRRLHVELKNSGTPHEGTPAFDELTRKLFAFGLLDARLTASYLRHKQHLDACAWSSMITTNPAREDKLDNVLGVVINNLPIPDEQTPWEHILEYRADPESRSRFLALRNWMREMTRSDFERREIEDKLEYLIDEHERHMRLHKMKVNRSTLETLLVTSTEFIESILKIKWSEATKKLFSLKERRIALVEAELDSPGKEVAFILDAHEKFGS